MMVEEVRMVPAIHYQLLILFVIGFLFNVHGSAGGTISPSPANFPVSPPEEVRSPSQPVGPFDDSAPSSASGAQPNRSNSNAPVAPPPLVSAPNPSYTTVLVPSLSPTTSTVPSLNDTSPPPMTFQGNAPSVPPLALNISPSYGTTPPPLIAPPTTSESPKAKGPFAKAPISVPISPVATPLSDLPPKSSVTHQSTPPSSPPIVQHDNSSPHGAPAPPIVQHDNSSPHGAPAPPIVQHDNSSSHGGPVQHDNSSSHGGPAPPIVQHDNSSSHGRPAPGAISPVATPLNNSGQRDPIVHHIAPAPILSPVPVMSPMGGSPQNTYGNHPPVPGESPSPLTGTSVSHPSTPSPSTNPKEGVVPIAAPSVELPPMNHSPPNGSSAAAPSTHEAMRRSDAPVPSLSSTGSPRNTWSPSPASLPSIPVDKKNHSRSNTDDSSPASSYTISPSPKQQGSSIPPSLLPTRQTHHAASPFTLGPSSTTLHPHFPTTPKTNIQSTPSPSPVASSVWDRIPVAPPKESPSKSSSNSLPVLVLPPPPPNEDCLSTICVDPYTNTPGSPCTCVLPMQVGLRLSVALYTFFPLVSELAQEIAAGVFMKESQVRIMGANAASQQPEKTIVLIDLVPLGERFDNTTAFLTFQRFWHKQVIINASYFGDYDVLYVHYPGLPPSPPSSSGMTIVDDGPYSGNNDNAAKPVGVDVQKRRHAKGLGHGAIAIIALSASVAIVLFATVAWVLAVRKHEHASSSAAAPQLASSVTKPSGAAGSAMGSGISSTSLSVGSSIATYTGSAKTFSLNDIERATNNFEASRILGEGGFGRVYSGVLDDGTNVAVKILKRDDHHSGREFLAEVEMLSRLHHRNLVKLIGICTEERSRCLVYELIPNGSVESHLHGNDKDCSPLDWDARIKIALGAARGLAYLHEDSSPRVIHRDFKASNILLEHDFTPKVSDFGLARTALDEENRHISTRVMGTFGYVAPEYAMTGHLLVKSDVYSYGVVLLELLTGRKPVDMTQPSGQENLVAWARPLLTTQEGLEEIIDPSLGTDVPFDNVAKVAAIASMCVQPEVSHRPFMGEVVQALKLVSNECDEAKQVHSRSSSHELCDDMDARVSTSSEQLLDRFQSQNLLANYESEPDIERGLAVSGLFSTSIQHSRHASGSFRRYSSSGPLTTGRGSKNLWQKIRRLRGEIVSEHGILFKTRPGSN